MRLLHSSEFYFHEFFDSEIPEYIILSHRWMDEEVSFQDFLANEKINGDGFRKISKFCELAHRIECNWVWIDTCCIDKKSSAELSEAINSMYRWYQNAKACYAYLYDVYPSVGGTFPGEDFGPWEQTFKDSVWFRRGWTLQELLAPNSVIFFDRDWQFIGTKSALSELIADVTGIDAQLCQGDRSLKSFSVAQRMSWAANRVTSRIEDMAYCLLGIFDINMPLLYGEGAKAFLRLQEEIIRYSDDESIFAWMGDAEYQFCLLAESPRQFAGSSDIRVQHFDERRPYLITNRGLQMNVPLLEAPNKPRGYYLVPLSCSKDRQSPLAILVRKGDLRNERFARLSCVEMRTVGINDQTWSFDGLRNKIIDVHLRPQ